MIPDIPGIEDVPYFTNESIFENSVLPNDLLIVRWAIGCEMAQAHGAWRESHLARYWSHLAQDDPDAVAVVRETLAEEGVDIWKTQQSHG